MTEPPTPVHSALDIRTVLLDLDGTLADTAPDLAGALNRVLREQHRPELPYERIRPAVSHGSVALVRLGFGMDENDPRFGALRQRLLEIYRDNLSVRTRLFPGMQTTLDALERRGMRWGVVTNKPGWLTEPLLESLGVAQRLACLVCGDTLAVRKPDPAPMLHACRTAGCEAPQCVYVGDARRDIEAGRNAGMHTLIAGFGYIDEGERPEEWGADALIAQPAQILDWLDGKHPET